VKKAYQLKANLGANASATVSLPDGRQKTFAEGDVYETSSVDEQNILDGADFLKEADAPAKSSSRKEASD
jgi:hypothetical protein